MKHLFRILPECFGIFLVLLPIVAMAKDKWVSVQSKNFFLVGNAGEPDIRRVAIKLEQFRDVFSRLFTKLKLNSSVPTTVIVFKSDASYRPFKPLYQGKPTSVAGYFQAGEDVNYITLTSELRETAPYAAIFHEYVHFLTNDNTRHSPLWFGEGLAEFYSTFEVSDGNKKVWLGKAIANHVLLLREKKFLPLPVLFSVEHGSPHYNEKEKQGVFYAESWALVHYLLLGDNGKRKPQFIRYLGLVGSGTPVEESFRQAFQADFATIEKELRNYIGRDSYPAQFINFDQKLEFDTETQATLLTPAEAQFYLGDLLLHTQRFAEAETYLKQALDFDPNLAPAQASLGSLCIIQQRWEEAKQFLQRATADSRNYLAHFHYAQLLSRERASEDRPASPLPQETAQIMRLELKKAIELAPGFLESYRLLAYVNLVTGEELDESVVLLKRARAILPGREEIDFDLGQLYLRKEDFAAARQMLGPIARSSSQLHLRTQAQVMLDRIASIQEQEALWEAARKDMSRELAKKDETTTPTEVASKPPTLRRDPGSSEKVPDVPTLHYRSGGEKAGGLLTRVECLNKGFLFVIKSGNRVLKFYSEDPERLLLFNEKQGSLGTITMDCGPLTPPSPVIVTFRRPPQTKYDGDLLTITFGNGK